MLLDNKDNFEKNCDFEEINSGYSVLHSIDSTGSINKQPEAQDILPLGAKIGIFCSGFAYAGLLVLSFIAAIIVKCFVSDDSLYLVLVQCLSYLALFGIIFAICFKYKNEIIKVIKDKSGYLKGLLFGLIIFVVEIILSNILYALFPVETNSNEALVENMIVNYPTLMFVTTVIIGPICEEMTYRVALCGMLKKLGNIPAIIISALIFGFVHISLVDEPLIAELVSFPIYVAIGALLAIAYKKYGTTCSFTAHASINLIAYVLTLLGANL